MTKDVVKLKDIKLTAPKIIEIYQKHLDHYNYFSDPQRIYITDDNYIVACIRDYDWYETLAPIGCNNVLTLKALFELDFIEGDDELISASGFWKSM